MHGARVTGFTVPTTLLLPPFDGCTILRSAHRQPVAHIFPGRNQRAYLLRTEDYFRRSSAFEVRI